MISQLSANNPNCPFIFSMCGDVHHTGGVLTVCGQGMSFVFLQLLACKTKKKKIGNNHIGSIAWTPMIDYDSAGFYNIYIQDFAVAGQKLGIDADTYNRFG